MKSILIAILAIFLLTAVGLVCLKDDQKTRAALSTMTRAQAFTKWVDEARVPPAIAWGLFGATVISLSRARRKN